MIVNAGLSTFTVDALDQQSDLTRTWIFFSVVFCLLGIKRVVDVFIPDVPDEVRIQLARQKLYTEKLFFDTEDAFLDEIATTTEISSPPIGYDSDDESEYPSDVQSHRNETENDALLSANYTQKTGYDAI